MKLSDKAIRVTLSISSWSGMAQEKDGAKVVEDKAGAQRGVVRARKYVLPGCDELKAIHQFNNAFRAWFYQNTLPWDDNGGRILPAENAQSYVKDGVETPGFFQLVGQKKAEGKALIDKFVAAYPTWYQKAQLSLGDLWDPKAYPSPDYIGSKFGYQFVAEPLPETEELRNFEGIPPEMREEIARDAAQAEVERISKAQGEIWKRLFEVTDNMANRLANPIGTAGAKFHDTLVTNIIEFVDLAPRLNVMRDPRVDQLVDDIKKKLLGVQPEALRINPELRAERAAEEDAGALEATRSRATGDDVAGFE